MKPVEILTKKELAKMSENLDRKAARLRPDLVVRSVEHKGHSVGVFLPPSHLPEALVKYNIRTTMWSVRKMKHVAKQWLTEDEMLEIVSCVKAAIHWTMKHYEQHNEGAERILPEADFNFDDITEEKKTDGNETDDF